MRRNEDKKPIKAKRFGLYVKKEGMTNIFQDNGEVIPVTVLKFLDFKILKAIGEKSLVFFESNNKVKQPQAKQAEKLGLEENKKGFTKEISGTNIDYSEFNNFTHVDIKGKNTGKGFQGVMKAYNFKGGRASHGNSLSHRSLGSTGCRQDPGKTYKNRKMPTHLGFDEVTQQNLKLVRVNLEKKYILVKGSVPGPKGRILFASNAIKKFQKAQAKKIFK